MARESRGFLDPRVVRLVPSSAAIGGTPLAFFGCDCGNVLGVSEARYLLAWLTAVDQLTPVAETTQAQGP